MDFSEAISTAWKIIWKHKVLWIFGILAGCSARSGGSPSFNYNFSDSGQSQNFPDSYRIEQFFESIPAWVWVALGLALLALVLLSLFLGTIGRIGLIRGAAKADEGAERLSFGELYAESLPYFWRVFLLNLLLGLFALILFAALIVPSILAIAVTGGVGAIAAVPLLCVGLLCLTVFFWVVGMVLEAATVAIVTENLSLGDGVQRGWSVFRANLASLVVIALFAGIGGGIVGFIISLPFLLVAVPIILGGLSGGLFDASGMIGAGLAVALVIFLAYLPISIVLNGALQTYIGTLWTVAFRRLTGHPAQPKGSAPVGAAVY